MQTVDGEKLSRLTFGTMQFGGGADELQSKEMFDAARAAGINHFDTAVGYTDGNSEQLLGQFVRNCRDEIFLASKLGYKGGSGRDNLIAQMERSRRQLQCDTVDLLYLHRFDDETPLEETFDVLARWQSDGMIRHIGVSNFAAWQVMKAQTVAARFGTKIAAIQPMYNLVKRQAEVELIPMAADQGIAVFAYSPLGGGLLTGKYASGVQGRLSHDPRYAARYDVDWMRDCAAALSKTAADTGLHPATLAVAWVKAHQPQVSPIISARSVAQLAPSLAAGDLELEQDDYARITALSMPPAPATDRLEET